jgi:hypothetical protein
MSGSKAGSKSPEISVEDDPFAEADSELRDLDAEVRPGERGGHAGHVAARSVGHRLQQTAPRAVDPRQGDEGAPEVDRLIQLVGGPDVLGDARHPPSTLRTTRRRTVAGQRWTRTIVFISDEAIVAA